MIECGFLIPSFEKIVKNKWENEFYRGGGVIAARMTLLTQQISKESIYTIRRVDLPC